MKYQFIIEGQDLTPDGYRDHLLYSGTSLWQVFKAIRDGLRNDMQVTIKRCRAGDERVE